MKKKLSSQWEFDDLFENAPSAKKDKEEVRPVTSETVEDPDNLNTPLSVSELTARIRSVLELEYDSIKVRGEITNLRVQSSGHIYFSIKDASAQIQCVLFRRQRGVDRDYLEDGQEVIIGGGISVYEARGQYQVIVRSVEPAGRGALQIAFDRLKEKLNNEGLFDQKNKAPLPRYISRLGVVTSTSGAAIKDFLHVLERRYAGLELFIIPSKVQGDGAASEIATGVKTLNQFSITSKRLDAILLTRGGGSLEDLWAFNEELLARTIFESKIPIISAVGHEIDFTISDFVADYRAATPSAAAEIITEPFVRAKERLEDLLHRQSRVFQQSVRLFRQNLKSLNQRHARLHPRRNLEQNFQRLDDLSSKLNKAVQSGFQSKINKFASQKLLLSKWYPKSELQNKKNHLIQIRSRLSNTTIIQLDSLRQRLKLCMSQIEILSPKSTLDRGFSITRLEKAGEKLPQKPVVRDAKQVRKGDSVEILLKSGSINAVVQSKET